MCRSTKLPRKSFQCLPPDEICLRKVSKWIKNNSPMPAWFDSRKAQANISRKSITLYRTHRTQGALRRFGMGPKRQRWCRLPITISLAIEFLGGRPINITRHSPNCLVRTESQHGTNTFVAKWHHHAMPSYTANYNIVSAPRRTRTNIITFTDGRSSFRR